MAKFIQQRGAFSGLRFISLVMMLWASLLGAAHASVDSDFLAARDAYFARNPQRLDQYARKLQNNVLAPWVQYWQLSLAIDVAGSDAIQNFLDRYPDSYLADKLRGEWLKNLGKQKQWGQFQASYPQLVNEDSEITCYQLQARLASVPEDASPLQEAKRLWFSGSDLPTSCDPLFERLVDANLLSVENVYARLRLALEAGNINVARHVAQYLPEANQLGLKPLEAIADNPLRFLQHGLRYTASRSGREMIMFAIQRLARSDPDQAVAQWESQRNHFSADERAYMAGHIAFYLARGHRSNALTWFDYAKDADLSDTQLGWKARAALRAQNWPALLDAIEEMSDAEQRHSEWRYWKARALKASGKQMAAEEQWVALSREQNFYGQLASEEIGPVIEPLMITYKATEDEIKAIQALPGIQRALALYRLNLRTEGTREWQWSLRGFDDRHLLAAAELAQRNELYDRAISAADRTQQVHDFALRYPAPHKDAMQTYTKRLQLDEAWVYGLMRQESRFINVAKSTVGASGMMQIMPNTAKWVAKKLGMKSFDVGLLHHLDTNFTLGTYYMKHVLDGFHGNTVLATAAYNAGPGRARRWQDSKPMEAAAYIESIPFSETRDYVKKVMSNSVYYAARFGSSPVSLKQRLGLIPAKAGTANDASDEP